MDATDTAQLQRQLVLMHRRAQRAEGKLQRAQVWLDMRTASHARSTQTPYVRREMDHFYFDHVRRELER